MSENEGIKNQYYLLVEKMRNKRREWAREQEYRLIKKLWCHDSDRIAVHFTCEWHGRDRKWFRSYDNKNSQFSSAGLMVYRHGSLNDLAVNEGE